jgi:FkbM family methyltransferase
MYGVMNTEVHFSTPDGTPFVSMPHNYSSLIVYIKNFRDPAIQKFMEQRLKEGSIYVDAGANIGTYTVRASPLVGQTGKVIAIEAHPRTYQYLQKNIETNNLKNVEPVPVALGAEHGSIEMAYTDANAGETHVAVGKEKSVSVPVRTLDTVLAELRVTHVDYIKIDVEGFEYSLLQGAKKIIAASENVVIQTELEEKHANRYGHSVREIIEFLKSFGLSPHTIDPDGSAKVADLSNLGEEDVLWWREYSPTSV